MRSVPLVLAAAFATFIAASPAANAQSSQRHRQAENYCSSHPRARDCQRHRQDNSTVGTVLRKTGNVIVGAGRVVGSAVEAGVCDARHKNYDQRTNTYRGNDGRRHRC